MTTTERNGFLLHVLEDITPVLHSLATNAGLEYEDLRQDATLMIMRYLEARPDIQNLSAYMTTRLRFHVIDLVNERRRCETVSLDDELDYVEEETLLDLLPCPYHVEPLAILLIKERLQEIKAMFSRPMQHQTRRMYHDLHETALAEVSYA